MDFATPNSFVGFRNKRARAPKDVLQDSPLIRPVFRVYSYFDRNRCEESAVSEKRATFRFLQRVDRLVRGQFYGS